jgi:Flp pilus assembly protein TadD
MALIALGWLVWKCLRDPKINFLPHDGRAEWIFFPAALDARSHPMAMMDATFRRTFTLDSQPKSARLEVRAAKRVELKINGEPVETIATRNWKQMSIFDVSRFLRGGENKIEARVFSDDAPPALWLVLNADSSSLRSDQSWEASIAGSSWRNCALTSVPRKPGPGNLLAGGERVSDVLPKIWRSWIIFGVLAILMTLAIDRWIKMDDVDLSRGKLFGLVGICALAWVILYWNNAKMLPFHSGYDFKDHVAYIKYIQEHGTVPLPNEGYEMFQPPLFYALAAGLLSIFHLSTDAPAAVSVLRALTMLFGIVNFVFVFLSLRLLFPKRAVAQFIGLIVAAFLPMELYLSHYVTNETLAATLASVSIYLGVRVLTTERASVWEFLALGVGVGAAMLAKATNLLLIPPLLAAVAIKLFQQRASISVWARTFGVTIATMLIVCGWYYVRIWRHFGTPIVGNWDPVLGFPWWQDPGFHTPSDYFRFGQSLIAPMFSGFNGFADGIYSTLWGESLGGGLSSMLSRTPWNYNLVIGGYWLALLPTLLVILGAAIAISRFIRRISTEWFLLLALSAATLIALVFMTLKVASYAQVKAFYGLAALVPFCAFAMVGWQTLTARSRALRSIITASLIFFAMNSFASVWIRSSSEQHTYNALRLISQSQSAPAVSEATAAVESDPSNASASYVLAAILDETGETTKALAQSEHCLELNPANGDCHFQLGIGLAKQGQTTRAMSEVQRALELLLENRRARGLFFALATELRLGEKVLEIGREALAVSPFDSELHYRVGLAAGEIGDFVTAANQFAYALLLDPRKSEHEQKLRISLSFLEQSSNRTNAIRDLQSLAVGSPKLLKILAPYRENPNSPTQDRQ